jgi:hypothetical protein
MNTEKDTICQICQRKAPDSYLENHHLIPGLKKGPTIKVCCGCGDQLHHLYTNKELEKRFNTLEAILTDERVQKWVKWVSKKSDFNICVKAKKRR